MNPTSSNSGQVRVRPINWEETNKKTDAQARSRLLQRTHPIDLKTAVIETKTQEELLHLTRHLHAGLSFWGHQYVYASPESLCIGTVTIKTLFEKICRLQFTYVINGRPDKSNSNDELDHEMDRIAIEDIKNCKQANLFTKICRLVMRMIVSTDHQEFWENYRGFDDCSKKEE